MNDQDYIRTGVELADGWSVRKGGQVTSKGGYLGHIDDQEIKDALAAQLVRQVDALGFDLVIQTDSTYIENGIHSVEEAINAGRTMNTIKAIVDSGVLK